MYYYSDEICTMSDMGVNLIWELVDEREITPSQAQMIISIISRVLYVADEYHFNEMGRVTTERLHEAESNLFSIFKAALDSIGDK